MLRMFSCAGACRVWGSHDLVRAGERRGILFCAELFFFLVLGTHCGGGGHEKNAPAKLTLFFRLRERAARATGRRRGQGGAPPERKGVGRGERREVGAAGPARKRPAGRNKHDFILFIIQDIHNKLMHSFHNRQICPLQGFIVSAHRLSCPARPPLPPPPALSLA